MSVPRSPGVGAAVMAIGIAAGVLGAAAQEIPDGYALAVDGDGTLRVPDVDYRATWTLLGVWIGAGGDEVDGETGANYVHSVYTQPGVADRFRETGAWPDGAVLVKELLAAETRSMTTGVVSHATELEGWFVMVKDRVGRFPGNALWGDGWGWAYFDVDAPTATTTESYADECIACHLPAQETDWIYQWGYPALQSADPAD